MRRPPSAGGLPDLDDDVPVDDLDLGAAPSRARAGGGAGTPRSAGPSVRRRRRALLAAACAAALLAASAVRHHERAVDPAATAAAAGDGADGDDGPPLTAWQEQQQRTAAHAADEAAALALLPDDLAADQRLVGRALQGAAPRLVDLDWSLARTSTVRDGAARTADGDPKLVDVARFARTSATSSDGSTDGSTDRPAVQPVLVPAELGDLVVAPPSGTGPATGVGWRISTPLQRTDLSDLCAVVGALPLPEAVDGVAPPECRLQTFTSASGEQQVVAVRTWEHLVDSPGAASPARVEVVHQAALVTDGRWAWSVAATAVGRPGTRAAVPPMSLDQVVLATRWLADAARGLPTPAPLDGTPLPGFSG